MSNTTPAMIPPIKLRDVNQQVHDMFGVTVAWTGTHWLHIILAVAAGAVIVAALRFARRMGRQLCARSASPAGWGAVFGRAIGRTGNIFMVMVAAKLVDEFAGAPVEVARTVDFLFTVASVFQAAVWAREIILGAVEHRTRAENDTGEALGSAMGLIRVLVTFALFAIALIVVLDNLGVNVTGLIAGLGVGGIAIGLAAQGIFADLFAALAIIFDRPFKRGDSVRFDQTEGTIEAIGLKSTRIRAFTGEQRVVANKNLLDKEITNNTLREHRRAKFTIGVTYQTPPDVCDRIPAMMQEIVEANGRKFVRAGLTGFGASSLDFELLFDSEGADFDSFYAGRTAIGFAILERFNAEGIDFAYPTQTSFTAGPDGKLVLPYPDPGATSGVR